jgi:hypothetical protein
VHITLRRSEIGMPSQFLDGLAGAPRIATCEQKAFIREKRTWFYRKVADPATGSGLHKRPH